VFHFFCQIKNKNFATFVPNLTNVQKMLLILFKLVFSLGLQTNETQHCLGKESALVAGGGIERVALIKSLIYARKKDRA
jgi:hypothetical protein